MIRKTFLLLSGMIFSASLSSIAFANDSGKWYAKLYGGTSILGDQTIQQTGVASAGATGKNENDTGFLAGGAVGYHYNNNLSAELAWDYITNGATNKFSDGKNFNDGDFSSSIFFLNGRYTFDPVMQTKFRPYLGAGIGYVEEIDMDLNTGGVETSYSQDGEIAYQLMAGASYSITENIDLDAGVRYVRVDGINLQREGGTSELRNVDYNPLLFAVGASYKF
ncbi:MAG: OmpW family outer membrane protein [Holosporales bacterium]|jgi:outer membrane protein W